MEKRTLADQGNTLVDLGKVREASEHVVFHSTSKRNRNLLSSNKSRCASLPYTDPGPDAEPDVRRAGGGAGLQRGAGLTHPHPGEARRGAKGGLQEPDAAPVQHTVHAELLHPPPAQGERGEDRDRQRERRQVDTGRGKPRRIQKSSSGAPGRVSGLKGS